MGVIIEFQSTISVEEFCRLREAVGFQKLTIKQAEKVLSNTSFIVNAVCEGKSVGVVRVLTDKVTDAYITDVIISPDFQGRGLGRKIMDRVLEQLNEYLSYEIGSPTVLRKTREILMNIWVYENDYTDSLRNEALRLIQKDSDYALPVHWCMMLAAYPVFRDMCRLIGKIGEFEEKITTKQIKQKLFDEWGERSTLYHSIDKLIATLKALDVLESSKVGVYSIKTHAFSKPEIVNFLLYTIMKIDAAGYYTLLDLEYSLYLFPFEYQVKKESIMEDDRFLLGTFGGQISFSLQR